MRSAASSGTNAIPTAAARKELQERNAIAREGKGSKGRDYNGTVRRTTRLGNSLGTFHPGFGAETAGVYALKSRLLHSGGGHGAVCLHACTTPVAAALR